MKRSVLQEHHFCPAVISSLFRTHTHTHTHIYIYIYIDVTYPPFCVAAIYKSVSLCKFPRSIKAEVSALWKRFLDQCDWNTKLARPTKGKGTVIPLQARCGSEGGRGIALLFRDRGTRRGWVVSSTPRPHLTPGKDPVPILQGAEYLVPTGIRSRTVQPVVSYYTDWSTGPTARPTTHPNHPSLKYAGFQFRTVHNYAYSDSQYALRGNGSSRNILHAFHTPSHKGKNVVYWLSLAMFRFQFYNVHKHSKCRGAFLWLPTSYEIKLPCSWIR